MPKKSKSYTVFVVDQGKSNMGRFQAVFKDWPHIVYYCDTTLEAQSIMVGVSPDIVIVNYQMPDIPAHQFLGSIQKNFQHAIRIVFSNEQDRTNVLRLVAQGLAHRFFCLPWNENGVAEQLDNDLMTRSRIRVRKCWEFLDSGRKLPILPEVVRKIEEILHDPDYKLDDVVDSISKDPVITAMLLKIVNSAAYPKTCPIKDLHHAVTFLGVDLTRKLVLFVCTTKYFLYPKKYHTIALKIIRHSLQCSRLTEKIAGVVVPGEEKAAATAALLHDIGKLVTLSALGKMKKKNELPPYKLIHPSSSFEKKAYGVTHLELGSSMLLWWNLPLSIAETAANHAFPLVALNGITLCVAIANRCLHEAASGGKAETDLDSLPEHLPLAEWHAAAREIMASKQ